MMVGNHLEGVVAPAISSHVGGCFGGLGAVKIMSHRVRFMQILKKSKVQVGTQRSMACGAFVRIWGRIIRTEMILLDRRYKRREVEYREKICQTSLPLSAILGKWQNWASLKQFYPLTLIKDSSRPKQPSLEPSKEHNHCGSSNPQPNSGR